MKTLTEQLQGEVYRYECLIRAALHDMHSKINCLYFDLDTSLRWVGDSPLDMLSNAIFRDLRTIHAPTIDTWFDYLERDVEDGYYPSLLAAFKSYVRFPHTVPERFNDSMTREELRRYFETYIFGNVFAYVLNRFADGVTTLIYCNQNQKKLTTN